MSRSFFFDEDNISLIKCHWPFMCVLTIIEDFRTDKYSGSSLENYSRAESSTISDMETVNQYWSLSGLIVEQGCLIIILLMID